MRHLRRILGWAVLGAALGWTSLAGATSASGNVTGSVTVTSTCSPAINLSTTTVSFGSVTTSGGTLSPSGISLPVSLTESTGSTCSNWSLSEYDSGFSTGSVSIPNATNSGLQFDVATASSKTASYQSSGSSAAPLVLTYSTTAAGTDTYTFQTASGDINEVTLESNTAAYSNPTATLSAVVPTQLVVPSGQSAGSYSDSITLVGSAT